MFAMATHLLFGGKRVINKILIQLAPVVLNSCNNNTTKMAILLFILDIV